MYQASHIAVENVYLLQVRCLRGPHIFSFISVLLVFINFIYDRWYFVSSEDFEWCWTIHLILKHVHYTAVIEVNFKFYFRISFVGWAWRLLSILRLCPRWFSHSLIICLGYSNSLSLIKVFNNFLTFLRTITTAAIRHFYIRLFLARGWISRAPLTSYTIVATL